MRYGILLALVVSGSVASAADRTHSVTLDDYATLAAVTQVAVSPDGSQVAYSDSRWDAGDNGRKADLWVVNTTDKPTPKRLTFDRANDRAIKWADAGTIYFLGNRKRAGETKPPYDGSTQIWRITSAGAALTPVTRVEGGVDAYDLAADGNIVFYSKEKTTHDDDAFAKLRKQFPADYGHGVRKVSEIHKLDTTTWRTETVYDAGRYVRSFSATRDGKKLALITAFDDTVVKSEGESRVDVWDDGQLITPPTDSYRSKTASAHAWLEDLAWSPDGKRFAFVAVFDAYPAEVVVGSHASSDGWTTAVLPRRGAFELIGYGRGMGDPVKWLDARTLLIHSERKGTCWPVAVNVATLDGGSEPKPWAARNAIIQGFDVTPDGKTLVAIDAAADRFPRITVGTPDGQTQRVLLDPNPHTATWKLPTVSHVSWKAADGSTVGGVLELPPGAKPGQKFPLVVGIHGGPTTSTKAEMNFDPHNGRLYFAVNGYAVLFPNYRGSTGYGDKFVTDLVGKENDVEVNDIIAGVEHLVKEGVADPDRVAVMGWSNGGYLTNCLITRKELPFRLRAASSGAGIVDTVAEWGFNDEPAYPKVFKKGHPWEQPESYKKSSPTYALGNVRTPTLIHVGGNDVRCPPGHSRMLYRALKEYVGVPTELVEYPGEPHGLGKLTHRRAKMEWDLAWFEKYVKPAK